MAKILRLKRNGTLYVGYDVALQALKDRLSSSEYVGEPMLARYKDTEESTDEHIILGITGGGNKYEIFDNVSVTSEITEAIEELDSSVSATAPSGDEYYVLTGITETDGKLTGKTEVKLAAIATTGSADDCSATPLSETSTHVEVTGNTVTSQIESLATTLKDITTNDKKYRLYKLSDAEVESLGDPNVKEAYKLISYTGDWSTATDKTQEGDIVKVYKDSSLFDVYIGHIDDRLASSSGPTVISGTGDAALCFIYILNDGTYDLVNVNIENFLQENEFGDGLDVNDHIVSVLKDNTSGKVRISNGSGGTQLVDVLTVSSDGVKIDNIQTAIDDAIDDAIIDAGDY